VVGGQLGAAASKSEDESYGSGHNLNRAQNMVTWNITHAGKGVYVVATKPFVDSIQLW